MLPMMVFEKTDPDQLRSYQEKPDLVGNVGYSIKRFDDPFIAGRVTDYTPRMADVFRPFAYCRFAFRVAHATGDVSLPAVHLTFNLCPNQPFSRSAVVSVFTPADLL